MRPLLLASVFALTASAGHAAPPKGSASKGRTNMFRGAYDPPKDPKHQVYYERLKTIRLLERFTGSAASIRLSKPLLVKFQQPCAVKVLLAMQPCQNLHVVAGAAGAQ